MKLKAASLVETVISLAILTILVIVSMLVVGNIYHSKTNYKTFIKKQKMKEKKYYDLLKNKREINILR